MTTQDVIQKLETSNQGIQVILDHLDEQLADIRQDPRLNGLMDDLENLFSVYLKTWLKNNTEIIAMLKEEKIQYTLKLNLDYFKKYCGYF